MRFCLNILDVVNRRAATTSDNQISSRQEFDGRNYGDHQELLKRVDAIGDLSGKPLFQDLSFCIPTVPAYHMKRIIIF